MNTTRRNVIKGISAVAASSFLRTPLRGQAGLISKRPPKDQRRFVSESVDAAIAKVKPSIGDPRIAWMFENCFPNTLDTTVKVRESGGKPDTFVITGDIDAMWLRDSSAQVWPYLSFAKEDKALRRMIEGVIRRQAACILIDSYANAFMPDPQSKPLSWAVGDHTEKKPGVGERKWEIDSLCYPIRLAHGYWKKTGDASPFDATFAKAMRRVVATFREQRAQNFAGPLQVPAQIIDANGDAIHGRVWQSDTESWLDSFDVPAFRRCLLVSLVHSCESVCGYIAEPCG